MLSPEDHIRNDNLCDDVERSLNLIYGGDSQKAKNKPKGVKASFLCGRYMIRKPSNVFPGLRKFRSAAEKILKTSDSQDLRNILLLITPVEVTNQLKNYHKVHTYCLDSNSHLGVTTLTYKELQLIERQHRPDTYSIVHSTQNIELDDAIRNTPIRDQIFKIARNKSKAVKRIWYRGNVASLSYRSSKSRFVGISPTQNLYGLRSLEHPKFPVRMQHQTPNEEAQISCSGIVDMNQRQLLNRNLQREFYYASQQCFNKKCIPLKKSSVCRHKLCSRSQRWFFKNFILKNKEKGQARKSLDKNDKNELEKGLQNIQEVDSMENVPQPEGNGVNILWKPHELRESMGHILLPSPNIELLTSFTHPMDPSSPAVSSHSLVDFIQVEESRSNPTESQDQSQLAYLVEQINKKLFPQQEHVLEFFRMAELLDFIMFVRRENSFPGFPSTNGRRFRIECYTYDNRQNYIASIALPSRQFRKMARRFPRATQNFRFVESAFELTALPLVLTNWLRSVFEAIGARPVYDFLGEIVYDWTCPRSELLQHTWS